MKRRYVLQWWVIYLWACRSIHLTIHCPRPKVIEFSRYCITQNVTGKRDTIQYVYAIYISCSISFSSRFRVIFRKFRLLFGHCNLDNLYLSLCDDLTSSCKKLITPFQFASQLCTGLKVNGFFNCCNFLLSAGRIKFGGLGIEQSSWWLVKDIYFPFVQFIPK